MDTFEYDHHLVSYIIGDDPSSDLSVNKKAGAGSLLPSLLQFSVAPPLRRMLPLGDAMLAPLRRLRREGDGLELARRLLALHAVLLAHVLRRVHLVRVRVKVRARVRVRLRLGLGLG